MINSKYVAIGGKDKNISIYTIEGTKVTILKGHQASICTLTVINSNDTSILMSGGDHGCSSVILWDTRNWTMRVKINSHIAAVTSIVDMGDN